MRRLLQMLRDEAGQSTASVAPVVASSGAVVAGVKFDVLPATGIAIGMYVAVALSCLMAGMLMRMWSRRAASRA